MNTINNKCIWGLEARDRHCEYCIAECGLRPQEKSIALPYVLIPKTIDATIEKSADGLYCISSDCKIGNSYFGGYGATEGRARADFHDSIKEAVLENVDIIFTRQED